jgi:uncharacterized protein (TIGR03435 family)
MCLTVVAAAAAQDARSRFAAAAVHENRSGGSDVHFGIEPGGRFTATDAPLSEMVKIAIVGISPAPFEGVPAWARTARYDITAKAEGEPTREQILAMVQALLVDRFGLAFHRESREMPAYFLVPARPDGTPGPRLRRASVNCAELIAASQKGATLPKGNRILCGRTITNGTLQGGGLPMETIAGSLTGYVGRPVRDRTGLAGEWDFDLDFAELLPADSPTRMETPTIFTALPEQLGLKLEAGRAPVEVIAVDRLVRPETD